VHGNRDPEEGGLGVDVAIEGDPVGATLDIECGDRGMVGHLQQIKAKNL
jgi:hypothetical protein